MPTWDLLIWFEAPHLKHTLGTESVVSEPSRLGWDRAMVCSTCQNLLAAYRRAVRLYTAAMWDIAEPVGHAVIPLPTASIGI